MTDFIQKDNGGKLEGLTLRGNYYKRLAGGKFYSVNSLSYLSQKEEQE